MYLLCLSLNIYRKWTILGKKRRSQVNKISDRAPLYLLQQSGERYEINASEDLVPIHGPRTNRQLYKAGHSNQQQTSAHVIPGVKNAGDKVKILESSPLCSNVDLSQ